MDKVYKYIIQKTVTDKIEKKDAVQLLELLKYEKDKARRMDIAVIGLSAKTSQAKNAEELWHNLENGFDGIREIPEERRQDLDDYLRFKGSSEDFLRYKKIAYLDEIDKFDYEFFGLSPREGELMDPNQRIFLESACAAIEDAGYDKARLRRSRTGLYLGFITANYNYQNLLFDINSELGAKTILSNMAALIPSRVSYALDLRGPSILVDTTCSSSLVAIHLACQALRLRECDQALVGGVKINLLPLEDGPKLGIESSTGKTLAFDEASDGTGQGEGVGVVMLKPLQDALRDGDNIRAVIKGSAINQDGQSLGISAPNPQAQTEVIKAAWQAAEIDPADISYIEAHGTGTSLGDPIEIEGITKAFRAFTDKKQFCAISSIKSNIGHLDEAAGIFGLIKSVLSLEKKKLPASINFHEPNHKINWEDSPVFVNTDFVDWQKRNNKLRLAGVSSFGLSGTNCHIVLEEAPSIENKVESASNAKILKLSARNQSSLKELASSYCSYLTTNQKINFENFCYTVNVGRSDYEYRLVILFDSREDLLDKLSLISKVESSFAELENTNSLFWGELKKNEDNFQSESEIKNRVINKILEKNKSKDFSEVDLEKISRLYTEGINFDWSLLYRKEKRQRLSLPTYPFVRKRCWFSLPKSAQKNNYFELAWREDEIISDPIVRNEILVFKGTSYLAQKVFNSLKQEVGPENLIEISLGDSFEKIDDNKFIIENCLADYEKLFSALAGRQLYQIVHLFSVDDKVDTSVSSLAELEERQNNGVLSLLNLSKALAKNRRTEVLNLVVVSNLVNEVTGQEKNIKPENAPLFGLTKGLFLEAPNWHCRAIDFDDESSLKNLILEIRNEYHDHKIAYRAGKRYVEEFRTTIPERKEIKIKNQGVYVFTGGTGGVALELEKALSRQAKINLLIITRSSFPSRDKWEALLKSEKGSALEKQIRTFLEIEESGTKIIFYQADVTQENELRPVIEKIKDKFGRIDGIIHAAGTSGSANFDQKTEEEFKSILAAKIQGTWLLDHLTREFDLDFFSLMSSAITCFGGVHNIDYIAGNSYLDSYAFWGRKQGINFTSVNWSFWKETGMHVRLKISNEKIPLKNIPPQQGGREWLLSLGNKRPGFLLVGEMNYVGRSVYLMKHSPFTFSSEILSEIDENINNFSQEKGHDEVVVKGDSSSKYSEIEKNIAQILYEVLGYKEIDIRDNFFDLGGDSLFLAEIFSRLEKKYSRLTNITQFFTYPTVAQLAKFLSEESSEKKITEIKSSEFKNRDIAVIGLAVKTSLADSYEELWENIKQKRECIREIPETRKRDIDNYLRMAGVEEKYMKYSPLAYLETIDKFDYEFFKFSPREAKLMDPNQRLFLETAMTAIEEAGYGGEKLRGTNTGLYLGFGQSDFEYKSFVSNSKMPTSTALFTGNLHSLIPSRVSYLLDLRGPSMVVDTACSSSLVSVHLACQALLAGDCEQAIAGGVRLNLVPLLDRFKIGIESSDWYTRSFDNESDGTGIGEGVAAVILKPLEKALADGDDIKAVIKGSAVNQDGQSVGITAPNTRAQADVVLSAWMNAQINPADISYIETHGTGTNLGDPIEIEALTTAFRSFTDKKQFCAISAVKPNLGHTLEAAGIFSFVKAVLALRDKQLPPSINFHEPNHKVDWENSAVYVNTSLTPWRVEDKKRLCGVSSFGLSGTNCHIVLSEAPQQNKFRLEKEKLNIFTISAKNKLALSELVDNYLNYLDKSSNLSLSDLCFTVNTGRGQYEERLAVVVNSISELKESLLNFKQNGYQVLEETDISYNFYKVVSEMKKEKGDNEFTEKELANLSREAEPFIAKATTVSDISRGFLRKICELYTSGAKIDWDKFYQTGTYRRLSLPTYPFQKTRCWADYNDQVQIESQTGSLNYLHPLLEKCLVKSPDQDVYLTVFSPKKHFVLSDHVINGSNVLPGTVYLEIAKQLGKLYYGNVSLEIKNLSFITPVITDKDEYKEVQIIVREYNGFKKFFAASRLENGSSSKWIRHVEGEIHPLEEEVKKVDWEDIKTRCQKQRVVVDINKNAAGFIDFGLRWQNYHAIGFGDREALAELELPKDCVHDLETYYLHPPMLDMAAAAVSMVTGFKALPFYYGSFRLFGPMPRKIYSHFHQISNYNEVEETISFDFDLLDAHGKVFAEVKDFRLKRTRDFTRIIKKNLGKNGEQFYKTYWEEMPRIFQEDKKEKETILVIGTGDLRVREIINKLKTEGNKIIQVNPGNNFEEINEDEFIFENTETGFDDLLKKLKPRKINKIIHTFSLGSKEKIENIRDLDLDLEKNVYSLFYLVKGLSENIYKEAIDIVLLTENLESVLSKQKINPIGATLTGFGKSVIMEYPNWRCRSIDVDKETKVDLIYQEIKSSYSEYKTAFRQDKRYQEILKKYEIEEIKEKNKLRLNGVYLITGGSGSIGLELAAYLGEQEKIKLILINRTSLEERDRWQELAKQEDKTGERYKKFLEVVRRIEKNGSEVEFVKVDISDYEEMKLALKSLLEKYGKLNGIIHAAGVAGDGFVVKKDKETIHQVLSPKVQGTWVIDELTKNIALDFFVAFSSTTALHSASGQSDYTAANSYLDAFSNYRTQAGRKTLLINWSGWRETGMLFESKPMKDYGLLSTAEALAGFMKVLQNNVESSVVGSIAYVGEIFKYPELIPLRFSSELKAELFRVAPTSNDISFFDSKFEELVTTDKFSAKNLEKVLIRIWQEVLSVKEIDVNDHFFDLGGDSLRIAEMHAILEKLYPGKFSVAELFAYPTIAKLIQHVGVQVPESEKEGNIKHKSLDQDIAIIGMAGRTSEAEDLTEFWENLALGKDCIREIPETRRRDMDNYLRFRGVDKEHRKFHPAAYLETIDKFDYEFFRISPREASLMDPNQRLLLETTYHAIEDAGYSGRKLNNTKTGLYVGLFPLGRKYYDMIADVEPMALSEAMVNNMDPTVASRISYYLNLVGPSMLVNTACSSSLVAIHLACQAIQNGDCDQALVGSVKISLITMANNPQVGIESRDGHTRSFDNDSDGTGLGEGVAMVMLKPLSQALADGDNIKAVIKGSAINQDGQSVGITAPNAISQTEVIRSAWQSAQINPADISYIEAHGTGTNLGDPIEIEALAGAFRKYTNKKQFCAISSVKANLGHLLEAAGIFGLVKTVLALEKEQLPPAVNFHEPNEKVNWEDSPVFVNDRLLDWKNEKGKSRLAGVSSFGLSGTNCHVLLESAPTRLNNNKNLEINKPRIFTISARTKEALEKLVQNYLGYLEKFDNKNFDDICYTVNTGRDHHNFRLAILSSSLSSLKYKLGVALENNFDTNNPDIKYGEFKIVQVGQKIDNQNEITEKEALGLGDKIELLVTEYVFGEKKYRTLIQKISELYVKGANYDWFKLYRNQTRQRLSLPLYPFTRKRCWFDIPGEEKYFDYYHGIKWQEKEVKTKKETKGAVLVFVNKQKRSQEILQSSPQENELIKVQIGKEYEKQDDNNFIISQTKEDYKRLLSELQDREISSILHLLSIEDETEVKTLAELERRQKEGIYSVMSLVQALQTIFTLREIDLFLVSENTDLVLGSEIVRPENATMIGFGKSIILENPNIRCCSIDIDSNSNPELIWKEIELEHSEYKIAYRNNKRYIEELGKLNLNDFPDRSLRGNKNKEVEIREGGVYLITGGTGGIGLKIAQALTAKAKNLKLILLGQHGIPDKSEWKDILETDGPRDKRLIEKVKSLQRLLDSGVKVSFVQADIADEEKVRESIKKVEKDLGAINGVFHTAGISGSGFIAQKGETALRNSLAPKVAGTWILGEIFKERDLDFMILFSSAITLISGVGVSDYTAANSYLDAYAYRAFEKGQRVLSIDWSTWENVGLSFGEEVDEKKQLLKILPIETALDILFSLIKKEMPRVVVGKMNYESDLVYLGDYLPLNFSAEINLHGQERFKLTKKQIKEVKLKGREADNYTKMEKELALIWSEVLGYDEIDIRDNFFELGGDSLSGIRLISRVNQKLNRSLSFREILQNASLKALARYVSQSDEVEYTPVIKKVEPKQYQIK